MLGPRAIVHDDAAGSVAANVIGAATEIPFRRSTNRPIWGVRARRCTARAAVALLACFDNAIAADSRLALANARAIALVRTRAGVSIVAWRTQ